MGEPSKHQISRGKGKICKDVTGEMVSMILMDNSYQTAWLLEDKAKIARNARDKLNDPLSVLKMLKLLMKPIITENTISGDMAKNALQVLKSVLEQPKHTVPHQYQANEIDKQKLFLLKGQETNVESHFQGDTVLNQGWTSESYEHLSGSFAFKGWTNETYVHLPGSFPVKGQETNVESHFPGDTVLNPGWTNETYKHLPGSFPFNGQEKNVESYFPGDLKQAISVGASTNKGLNVDPLEMLKYKGASLVNLDNLKNVNNENNIMIEEFLDLTDVTTVKDYTVFKHNANIFNEILQKHPNIDEKFQIKDPEFQSFIVKSLAIVYQKIESKPGMLKLEEIPGMEAKIQAMEISGLQLSWLKGMLEEVSKMLKDKADKAEMKRLREEIISNEAEINKKKEKLAKLEKGKETIV